MILIIMIVGVIALLALAGGDETIRVVVFELLKVAVTIILSFFTAKYTSMRVLRKENK